MTILLDVGDGASHVMTESQDTPSLPCGGRVGRRNTTAGSIWGGAGFPSAPAQPESPSPARGGIVAKPPDRVNATSRRPRSPMRRRLARDLRGAARNLNWGDGIADSVRQQGGPVVFPRQVLPFHVTDSEKRPGGAATRAESARVVLWLPNATPTISRPRRPNRQPLAGNHRCHPGCLAGLP